MKYIFENEHETLFETNDCNEMHDFIDNFEDELIFANIYESMDYTTIHFYGYNLMIRK